MYFQRLLLLGNFASFLNCSTLSCFRSLDLLIQDVGLIQNNAAVGSQIACHLANLPGFPLFPGKGFPAFENKFGKMENRSTSGTSNSAVRMTEKSNQNNSHPAAECVKNTSVSNRLSGKTAKRMVSMNSNLSDC